jgi:hypothetical protein
MEWRSEYPAKVEQDEAGFYLVTFPDFPDRGVPLLGFPGSTRWVGHDARKHARNKANAIVKGGLPHRYTLYQQQDGVGGRNLR